MLDLWFWILYRIHWLFGQFYLHHEMFSHSSTIFLLVALSTTDLYNMEWYTRYSLQPPLPNLCSRNILPARNIFAVWYFIHPLLWLLRLLHVRICAMRTFFLHLLFFVFSISVFVYVISLRLSWWPLSPEKTTKRQKRTSKVHIRNGNRI